MEHIFNFWLNNILKPDNFGKAKIPEWYRSYGFLDLST